MIKTLILGRHLVGRQEISKMNATLIVPYQANQGQIPSSLTPVTPALAVGILLLKHGRVGHPIFSQTPQHQDKAIEIHRQAQTVKWYTTVTPSTLIICCMKWETL